MIDEWAVPGGHAVQFYDNEPLIQHAIAQYFACDARPGDQLIMVSRPRTFKAIGEHLASGRHGPAIATDRVRFVDAEAALYQIMDGQTLDKARTERLFKQVLSQASPHDAHGTIRIYGELVDLLCQHGSRACALQVEDIWGALLDQQPRFSLLCGYATKHFRDDASDVHFHAVCRKHTHVVPAAASTAAPVETVYLVDDNEGLRGALKRLLTASNLSAHTFGSAEEFLAELNKLVPGCLIVDVELPGMSGLGLVRWLRDAHVSWPIIVISGLHDDKIESEVLSLGGRAFLRKPFEPQALLDEIARSSL
jgi:CheY-like chemotaxis protein